MKLDRKLFVKINERVGEGKDWVFFNCFDKEWNRVVWGLGDIDRGGEGVSFRWC